MLRVLLFSILAAYAYGATKDTFHRKVFCEHRGAKEIGCPKGQVLMVLGGNYGRLSVEYCRFGNFLRTNCRAHRSDLKMKRMCNNKEKCRIDPSNKEFSDPCVGVTKYASVFYKCVSKMPTTKKAVICEKSGPKFIACPKGSKINIVGGNFGRLSVQYCRHENFRRTNCRATTSSQQMRLQCNGHNKCHINPTVSVYGDPCVKISKYASIEYQCH